MDPKEARELYDHDYEQDRPNRERMIADLEFTSGEQWEEADRLSRASDSKPTHTINRLPQFVRQVVGDIRQTEPSIQVKADGSGADEDSADIYNGLMRQIIRRSSYKQPFVNAVDGAVKGGIGHFRVDTAYSPNNPFNQDIEINPIHNALAVLWDAGAREPTKSDAHHCWVVDSMTERQFQREYPKAKKQTFDTNDYTNNRAWFGRDNIKVAEFWQVDIDTADYALLDNGYVVRMDRKPQYWKYDELNQAFIDLQGNPHFITDMKSGPCRKVSWKKMNGVEVLEEQEWSGQYIPIISVVGDQVYFPDRVERFSLIHWAIEPQRMFNYWRSTQAGIVGSALKSAIAIGASQLGTFATDIDAAIKGNKPWFPYDDSVNPSAPQRIMPPQIEPAIMNEVGLAAEDMKATTGIYDAALGSKSNETSGVAIRQRQAESDISTSLYGDNLKNAIEYAGRVIVDLIPYVYDAERAVRILYEDDTDKQVVINQLVVENGVPKMYNDLTTGTYDVSAQVGASFATRRQESLEMITDLLRGSPEMVGAYFDLLIDLADIPKSETFVERARKINGMTDENEEITPEQQAQQQQAQELQNMFAEMEMRTKQAETQESEAGALKARSEAEEAALDVILKKIEANGRMGELQAMMAQLAAPRIQGPLI